MLSKYIILKIFQEWLDVRLDISMGDIFFNLILVWFIFFFYRLCNFARGHDFDRSRDNHKIKSASRVAGTYTRRSAPVPTVVMVRALAVRCFVVAAHMYNGCDEKSNGTNTSLCKLH